MNKPGDKPSFWKQEITFRRTPKGTALPERPPAKPEEGAQPEQTSIWKKEISFKRKPKEEPARASVAPVDPPQPEPVAEPLRPLAEQPAGPVDR
jgi:hypothetical protein